MERALVKSLHELVRDRGSLEEIRSLLEEGVDVEEKDLFDFTPLLSAALEGHKDVCELLISAGANIKCCTIYKWTLLHYSAYQGWLDTAQYLIGKGLNVDVKDISGNTPLLVAAVMGHKDVCELLIKAGADVNVKNTHGDTALHAALFKSWNDCEIVDHLLRAGADYNWVDMNGETPLYLLMKGNKIDSIRLCLKMGACADDLDCEELQELPFFKSVFLRDAEMCAEAIINKFNKRDLPLLYGVSAMKRSVVDRLRRQKGSGVALEVEQAVTLEIQAKGYCNVVKVRPVVLSMLAIRSLIEVINSRGTSSRALKESVLGNKLDAAVSLKNTEWHLSVNESLSLLKSFI